MLKGISWISAILADPWLYPAQIAWGAVWTAIFGMVGDKMTADPNGTFAIAHTEPGATIYTDEAVAYRGLPFAHHVVNHSAGEYVSSEEATTNGVESFWALL